MPNVHQQAAEDVIQDAFLGLYRRCGCSTPPPPLGFLEYSTATGRLVRVLYQYRNKSLPSDICQMGTASVFWASPTGSTVIGYVALDGIGLWTSGLFTPGKVHQVNFAPLAQEDPDSYAAAIAF